MRTRRTAPQRPLTRPCLPLGRPAPKASPQGPVGGCAAAVRPGRSRRCCGLAHAGGPAADRPLSQPHGHARRGRGAADRHDRAGASARSATSAGRRHLPNQGARTESNWKKVFNRAHTLVGLSGQRPWDAATRSVPAYGAPHRRSTPPTRCSMAATARGWCVRCGSLAPSRRTSRRPRARRAASSTCACATLTTLASTPRPGGKRGSTRANRQII